MGMTRDVQTGASRLEGVLATVRIPNVPGLDLGTLLRMHRLMVLARSMDEAELRLRKQQKTFFEVSGAGHEAVQAAAAMLVRPGRDWFYPYYRDRTFCLGLGITPVDMMLQSMGKAGDPSSGGREMPCHYGSVDLNVVNQSSPTGTQYLQAVGTAEAGMVSRLELAVGATNGNGGAGGGRDKRSVLPAFEDDELVYVSGGEGSTSEGEFYEALSLACQRKLPVVFLIQDNAYAISVPVEVQTPGGSISRLVSGFPNLLVEEIDGVSLVESYIGLRRAVAHARAGKGPALVHAQVVRLWPHSDSDEDRAYRTPEEKAAEATRDPIALAERLLLDERLVTAESLERVHVEVRAEVEAVVEEAQRFAPPEPQTAGLHLYNPRAATPVETEPPGGGAIVTMVEAIHRTLEVEMHRDPRILCFGEDIADLSRSENLDTLPGKGGVFKVTHDLQRKFGDHRVFNTPIAEASIVGRAIGLAVRGFLPVPEIQFFDYIWPAMQQIRNELAMMRWRSNNAYSLPVVLRVPVGGYLTGGGPYHSQSGESIFCHCPGLRVLMPSNARDAAGLLRAALRCGDPVLFLEHKHLYRRICSKGPDPGPDHVVPIGKARMVREGKSVSVITYGTMVEKSLRAAEELALEGIEVEILDLRSLEPYDWEAIRASVSKTNRVVVAHEDARSFGYGAEIAARIAEELFGELDAPVGRVGALDLPVAYSPVLEQATLPQIKDAYDAIRRVALY